MAASEEETWGDWLRHQLQTTLAIDLRALASMRIALGLLVVWDAVARWEDAADLYSDAGFWTRAHAGVPTFPGFGFYQLTGDPGWTQVGLGLTAILGLAFAAGALSRPVTVLLWLMLGALHTRNWWVVQGGDDLLRNFTFWCAFLPVGARWSVDAWRAGDDAPRPVRIVGPAAVVLYVQLFLLYFMAGVGKAHHAFWWRGEGVYYALHADHFAMALGRALRGYEWPLRVLGVGALLLEVIGPFILVLGPPSARVRGAVIASFVALHLGIAATLRIGLFSFVCLGLWCFTVPTPWMDRLEARIRGDEPAGSRDGATIAASSRAVGSLSVVVMVGLIATATVRNALPAGGLKDALMWPARAMALQDSWSMFTGKREHTGWFVAPARQRDRSQIDLLRGAPLSWERPHDLLEQYPNQRWRKLWVTFRKPRGASGVKAYLSWLCRTGDHVAVAYVYVRHAIGAPELPPSERLGREQRVTVAHQSCR